jgi:hypothetical protein
LTAFPNQEITPFPHTSNDNGVYGLCGLYNAFSFATDSILVSKTFPSGNDPI